MGRSRHVRCNANGINGSTTNRRGVHATTSCEPCKPLVSSSCSSRDFSSASPNLGWRKQTLLKSNPLRTCQAKRHQTRGCQTEGLRTLKSIQNPTRPQPMNRTQTQPHRVLSNAWTAITRLPCTSIPDWSWWSTTRALRCPGTSALTQRRATKRCTSCTPTMRVANCTSKDTSPLRQPQISSSRSWNISYPDDESLRPLFDDATNVTVTVNGITTDAPWHEIELIDGETLRIEHVG